MIYVKHRPAWTKEGKPWIVFWYDPNFSPHFGLHTFDTWREAIDFAFGRVTA